MPHDKISHQILNTSIAGKAGRRKFLKQMGLIAFALLLVSAGVPCSLNMPCPKHLARQPPSRTSFQANAAAPRGLKWHALGKKAASRI